MFLSIKFQVNWVGHGEGGMFIGSRSVSNRSVASLAQAVHQVQDLEVVT